MSPGGEEASLVALDATTGQPVWQTAGPPPGYGSLIVAELGCIRQIVGHDANSLGGWDPATGRRLWRVVPERANDFNVPTPLVHKGRLIVATENNGLRAFDFDDQGQIVQKPAAINEEVLPDTQSPVIIDERLFVSFQGLYCFDLHQPWKVLWKGEDPAFEQHASLIASQDRLLTLSHEAELLLMDAHADSLRILGRCRLVAGETGLLAHPALVDRRLYVRTNDELLCVDLEP